MATLDLNAWYEDNEVTETTFDPSANSTPATKTQSDYCLERFKAIVSILRKSVEDYDTMTPDEKYELVVEYFDQTRHFNNLDTDVFNYVAAEQLLGLAEFDSYEYDYFKNSIDLTSISVDTAMCCDEDPVDCTCPKVDGSVIYNGNAPSFFSVYESFQRLILDSTKEEITSFAYDWDQEIDEAACAGCIYYNTFRCIPLREWLRTLDKKSDQRDMYDNVLRFSEMIMPCPNYVATDSSSEHQTYIFNKYVLKFSETEDEAVEENE
ncbi:MAG: hypothetical protein ACWGQW_04550 [bacterium]